MRTTMFLYLPSWSWPWNTSHTMRHCKCKPVQASFSSCFGQLFSKIFNFSCVLLPLLIWLLNAWVCACLNVCGNREEKRIRKEPSKSRYIYIDMFIPTYISSTSAAMRTTMFLYLPSWSWPWNSSHTMRHCKCKPVQASFSSCFGQPFSKIFNFSCVLLPLLIWLLNAWVCACLNVCGNREEKRIRKEPSKSICIYIQCI